MPVKIGIGQDSHRLTKEGAATKPLMLGGVRIASDYTLEGNSDADVVLHALCNAVSSVSGAIILGPVTDRMCEEEGITDSTEYLQAALKTLSTHKITHVAVSIECKIPRIVPHIESMRRNIAELLDLSIDGVGITATSGEGLTDYGRGLGIQAFVVITTIDPQLLSS